MQGRSIRSTFLTTKPWYGPARAPIDEIAGRRRGHGFWLSSLFGRRRGALPRPRWAGILHRNRGRRSACWASQRRRHRALWWTGRQPDATCFRNTGLGTRPGGIATTGVESLTTDARRCCASDLALPGLPPEPGPPEQQKASQRRAGQSTTFSRYYSRQAIPTALMGQAGLLRKS